MHLRHHMIWMALLLALLGYSGNSDAGLALGTRATILLFVGSHCPCSDPHRALVAQLVRDTAGAGVHFYAVFSNRGEATELVQRFMRQTRWDFTTIIDTDGTVQSRYRAMVTPEAIVLDARGGVVYRGAIDDSVPNMGQVLHPYLRTALTQLLAGMPVTPASTIPYGCYITR